MADDTAKRGRRADDAQRRGKSGVGRRSDAQRPKREIVLTLRVNDAERRTIERVAKRHDLGVSTLLRAAALDLDDEHRLRSEAGADDPQSFSSQVLDALSEIERLRVEVNRVGVNLNQLTRLSHQHRADGLVTKAGDVDLHNLLIETRDLVRELSTALGVRGHGV